MKSPLVSILIPTYNRENLIKDAIESALNQTYKNIEIIIVDNKSIDNTWQVIKSYEGKDSRIKAFQNKKNIGPVLNWKECVSFSKGSFVKFLFSDDYISENYIEQGMKLFDSNTSFVLSPVKIVNESNLELKLFFNYNNLNVINKRQYFFNILFYNRLKLPVSPGAAIFRSENLLKKIKVFDLNNPFEIDFSKFGAGPDLLIYLNSAKRDKIKISLNTTAFFRSHKNSFSISNNLILDYEFVRAHFIFTNFKFYRIMYFFTLLFKSIYRKEIRKLVPYVFANLLK